MELADKPIELRKAEGAYRRLRERFEAAARLFVLAGCVELVGGDPMPLEETFAARRAFVSNRRERQEARRQRIASEQAQRTERTTTHIDVTERVEGRPTIAMADVGMTLEGGITKLIRPRKRADVADAADVGSETNRHNVDVSIGEGEL
jgi:hypothetical protein